MKIKSVPKLINCSMEFYLRMQLSIYLWCYADKEMSFQEFSKRKLPAFDIENRNMCNGDTILTVENFVFYFSMKLLRIQLSKHELHSQYWFIFLEYFLRFVYFIHFLIFWVILYWEKKMYKNYCIERTQHPGDMFWDKCHLLEKLSFIFIRLIS